MNLAVESGCDALHPGYGFLSENAELAEICAERGIKFIGPSAQVIRRMGDKTEARRSMIAAGVPCTPAPKAMSPISPRPCAKPSGSATR